MPVNVAQYNNVAVLAVKEELTGEAVPGFVQAAQKCLADGQCQIVVDGTHLEGLDSSGLEALVDLQNQCEERLGTVKLCHFDAVCSKILEITRLSRRFEMFDDLESAVKSFA